MGGIFENASCGPQSSDLVTKLRRFILLVTVAWGAFGASTEIKVDQVGYLPDATKLAMLVHLNGRAERFMVRRAGDDSIAFEGKLSAPVFDADSGDQVQAADFTKLTSPGEYYVEIPDVGRSWRLRIAPNVYLHTYFLAMRSYYGQRCGTAVDLSPDFPQYKHAACHLEGAFHPSSGKDGTHVSSHGWHDAGDYGRYMVNSGISTGTVLWTWEIFQDRIKKISLHLPESGNGLPDLLNEARWNLDWMLTMQDDDGGVWHKQTSTHFCAFIMPEADQLTSYVIGTGSQPYKSSCATADFAAVMAIAARLYQPFDAAYANRCLAAAKRAWNWVEQNPDVVFHNPPGISTGDYGDPQCDDEHLWAAAELSRTTGDATYTRYFRDHYREHLNTISSTTPPTWSMVAPLALWSYVLGNGRNAEASDAIRRQSLTAADEVAGRAARNPYRIALTRKDYIWGSNGVLGNYALQLLIANRFRPDARYRDAALDSLHYLLGRNALSLSFVTQVGENYPHHPHHRPSAADGVELPWPGLLVGGPNPGRQDGYMKKLLAPDVPAAKMYVDVEGAYACNEVAINWNAPLVFLLASVLPE